jgi:hypothetical protein
MKVSCGDYPAWVINQCLLLLRGPPLPFRVEGNRMATVPRLAALIYVRRTNKTSLDGYVSPTDIDCMGWVWVLLRKGKGDRFGGEWKD